METCVHCDEAAVKPVYLDQDLNRKNPFCCEGCLTVYDLIHAKGLESYYEIKHQSSIFKRRSPVELKASKFTYLDTPEFLKEYSYQDSTESRSMEFYLEGIHCLACLWLIEKLPEFVAGIETCKLDLDRSIVTVTISSSGSFASAAKELNQLGYRPHPLKRNQESHELRIREDRTSLLRIGVAGAAAGNIMLYAVSLYGGASGEFAQLFNAITVILAFPVLTFCAWPFYQNAWIALKNKGLSIDIPISLSLLMGAVMGLYNMLHGVADNYFDSLTTLVFLLLMSRYFLQRIQSQGFAATDLNFFYHTESVLRRSLKDPMLFEEAHPRFVKSGDVLKILPGEMFPADGKIISGAGNINLSLLTGESIPVKVNEGDQVFSGALNLNQEMLVEVSSVGEGSRLGRILKNVENGWAHKSRIVNLTNRVSKYFTSVVFALAALLFFKLFITHDFRHALEGAMTLMIVTCPCALALAVPLTLTRSLSLAARNGIIIKNDEVLEKLTEVKNVFLDKTGTITHGWLKITRFDVHGLPKTSFADIIYHLECHSRHPVGRALLDHVRGQNTKQIELIDFCEIPGHGVSGSIDGSFYEITRKGIYEDGFLMATFDIEDTVRADSREALEKIQAQGIEVRMLSGDREGVVKSIAADVGLAPEYALAELSPEQKSHFITQTPKSVMVGDGANDSMALGQAYVGVAVLGAMDISLRAADVYLTSPGLEPLNKLLTLSQETMKVIRRNLVLSLAYNSLSVAAAFFGYISPLVAAIIMPLSSLTVLCSSLIGTRTLRSLWKS